MRIKGNVIDAIEEPIVVYVDESTEDEVTQKSKSVAWNTVHPTFFFWIAMQDNFYLGEI